MTSRKNKNLVCSYQENVEPRRLDPQGRVMCPENSCANYAFCVKTDKGCRGDEAMLL
jgi:hypothetical protein